MCYNSSMARLNNNINNHLVTLNRISAESEVGGVLTLPWLKRNTISPKLAWWYVHSGWLEHVDNQLYKKPNVQVDWTSAVLALQHQLNLPIHIGGKTALAILGKAHFLSLNGIKEITLFAEPKTKFPSWLSNQNLFNTKFKNYRISLFADSKIALVNEYINYSKVVLSSPERAILEILYLMPEYESFDAVSTLLKDASQLRPSVMQALLESCNLARVKRMFLVLAEKHRLPCIDKLDISKIKLGNGKYVIDGGGEYNSKYQISFPILSEEE